MAAGGHTTVIQRVLERRAAKPASGEEGTTATVAVMVRVMPPPKALLVFQDAPLRQHMERRVTPDLLEVECLADEQEALRSFEAEFRPVVVTDSAELIRKLRSRPLVRPPFIIYVSEVDDSPEREAGILAGADECVGRRVTERELEARLRAARRIGGLESVLRLLMAEPRRRSARDDLARG